ncbi:cell wall-binding repeat-containing protein [Schaalia sp. 19OD2882]|uniref:cell wall-binding repeat-containing protein n=1 Tax=Schaalia sp. 19OD2882 TaxID=2794089 RepID=UPI001C1EE40B|nr:cell wall-binding repeat-containing protein [Schaalia sp. 19OD2882]QWW20265.1 cell wall-binding repeat-containing protein [Schaalia sp. 19OD2882]
MIALSVLVGGLVQAQVARAEPSDPAPEPVEDPQSTTVSQVQEGATGDPNADALPVPGDEVASTREATSNPIALHTNAVTAGTSVGQRVVTVSRSSSPGQVNVVSEAGRFQYAASLPVGTGAWAIVSDGATVVIGTNNPASVVEFDPEARTFKGTIGRWPGEFIMDIARDRTVPGARGRWYWVGSYTPTGPRLRRINLDTFAIEDHTPTDGRWRDVKYVRSLDSTAGGLLVGLGAPARVERFDAAAGRAVGFGPGRWRPAAVNIDGLRSASFPYAMASQSDSAPDTGTPLTAIGQQSPAVLRIIDSTGLRASVTPEGATAIDRVAAGRAPGEFWFTTRPDGALHRVVVGDDGTTEYSVIATPVSDSETRMLQVAENRVSGLTGTGDLWSHDLASGQTSVLSSHEQGVSETPDTVPQGIARLGSCVLVGGHYRYQAHGSCSRPVVPVPGEPKVQTMVGEDLYAATYPNSKVLRINTDLDVAEITTIGHGQSRPRAIQHMPETNSLWVSTRPDYGRHAGALTRIDLATHASRVHQSPFGNETATAIAARGTDLYVGTETVGEAVDPLPGSVPRVARMATDASGELTVRWKVTPFSRAVATAGIVSEDVYAPAFVLALATDGELVALDPRNGATKWRQDIGGYAQSMRVGPTGILVHIDGMVRALAVSATGARLSPAWNQSTRWAVLSEETPSVADGVSTDFVPALVTSSALTPRWVRRHSGPDRYATSAAVSASLPAGETMVMATGGDFPDALSGASYAAHLKAPLVLVHGAVLPAPIRGEIERRKATRVILVGGTGALPPDIETQLRAAGVRSITRVAGNDRFATSVAVARRILSERNARALPVVLATGNDFPDALSAVPLAAGRQGLVLLTSGTSMSAQVRALAASAPEVFTVGGQAEQAARSAGVSITGAHTGSSRYETADKVALRMSDARTAVVVTGKSFPDALSGSVLAAQRSGVILLDDGARTHPWVARQSSCRGPRIWTDVVGGTGVVGGDVERVLTCSGSW